MKVSQVLPSWQYFNNDFTTLILNWKFANLVIQGYVVINVIKLFSYEYCHKKNHCVYTWFFNLKTRLYGVVVKDLYV